MTANAGLDQTIMGPRQNIVQRYNIAGAHSSPDPRAMQYSFVPGLMSQDAPAPPPPPPPPHPPPPSSTADPRSGSVLGGLNTPLVDQQMRLPQLSSQPSHLPPLQTPGPSNGPGPRPPTAPQSSPRAHQLKQEDEDPSRPAVKHRRAPVACRRCRRLRSKCVHTNAKPPCVPCYEAGSQAAADCFFPARGEPDEDRQFRRRRAKASEKQQSADAKRGSVGSVQKSPGAGSGPQTSPAPPSGDKWELLPPLDEVIEGCRAFFTQYFQLGFLPKAMFIERLKREKELVNPFLLLGLMSIIARFVPNVVKRYGGGLKATELMIERARAIVPQEMYEPSLERIQGFFLLAVAEWGNGDKVQSTIHMGIAVRMAGIIGLHQEEAYSVPKDATADQVVNSEVSRRTFWVLISQECLHSGAATPASFSLNDITALLPCDENDFAFGQIPVERAALSGTLAAKYNERLVWLPSRSLFATLIQAHSLWGQCARATRKQVEEGPLTAPWQPSSRYSELSTALQEWESNMPQRQRWSVWNLRGYRSENLDLAYLAVVMVIRLSNIVIRRVYLEDIKNAMTNQPTTNNAPSQFWQQVSLELFNNVMELHEQIDAFFSLRSQDEGFPAILVFCIYTCGSLAYYLSRWPQLCPHYSKRGIHILNRSMEVLKMMSGAWPVAVRWQHALTRVVQQPVGPVSGNINAQGPSPEQYSDMPSNESEVQKKPTSQAPNLDVLVNVAVPNDPDPQIPKPSYMPTEPQQQEYMEIGYPAPNQFVTPVMFPNDDFEMELNAFLQGGDATVFWNGLG